LVNWDAIKAKEKEGKEDVSMYLPEAFEESKELIDAAAKRKKEKMRK
jgi:tetrapyrrole methylase family protein/MazG family protein